MRGASGGVGSVAVQLGKALGAHVTGLASAKNLDFVRDLGADEALDHRATPLSDLDRYDVILDTVGTEHRALRQRLTAGGRLVSIAFDIDHPVRSVGYLLGSAVHGRRRVRFFSGNPKHDLLAELTAYVEREDLRPVVDTVRPLAEIAAAHRALEAGGVRGKHVIHLV